MPLGTLDRTPPPMFKQGPSALSKTVVCVALALGLMVADARFHLVEPLRKALATAVMPLQQVLNIPVSTWNTVRDYTQGAHQARIRESEAAQKLVLQSERALQAERLLKENDELRSLLKLRPTLNVESQPAEVIYEAPDPFSRKLIIDRGSNQHIESGSPVINANGVLGQVTRVYPLTAEVTLLTDREAIIPVLNQRTYQRGIAYGDPLSVAAGAGMELRFSAHNADLRVGDLLTTSGVDGIYPGGIPVATVTYVDRRTESSFAKVMIKPVASQDGIRLVMVLSPLSKQLPPAPPMQSMPPPAPRSHLSIGIDPLKPRPGVPAAERPYEPEAVPSTVQRPRASSSSTAAPTLATPASSTEGQP